jgi:hypothetical protein
MADATVLLLGGSSGVGKTRLARQLAWQLGMDWLSADDIRLALQRATRGAALPALHAFFDDLPTLSAEAMATRYLAVAEIVSHALEIVIAHHIATASPVVVEGDTILPALAVQQSFAELSVGSQVRGVFLVESGPGRGPSRPAAMGVSATRPQSSFPDMLPPLVAPELHVLRDVDDNMD